MSTDSSFQQPASLTIEQALQQAIIHHNSGQWQDAERLYRAILQAMPNQPDANHNLGVLAVQAKKPAMGLPHFKAALDTNPNQDQYWLSYIDALIKADLADTARQILEQGRQQGLQGDKVDALSAQIEEFARETEPSKPVSPSLKNSPATSAKDPKKGKNKPKTRPAKPDRSHNKSSASDPKKPSDPEMNALVSAFVEGRHEEAATLAGAITRRFPAYGIGWKALGTALNAIGRSADALVAMQKATALSPADAEAHYNLGALLQDAGRLTEAETSYRKAVQIKPVYAGAYSNLGITLHRLGRLDEAEASYRRAIEIKPDYAEAHYNLGITFKNSGQLDEAEASYRRALQVKPDYAEAHNSLGTTLQDLGRLDEAEASYRQALKINIDYAASHNNLGNTLTKLGRLAAAETSYRQALQIRPDFAEAHFCLGNTLKALGRPDEAEAAYGLALQIRPDYPETLNNLGSLLYELNRFDEAETCYRRALKIRPDHATAHNNLGNIFKKLDRLEEAKACYLRAMEIQPDFAEAHYNLSNVLQDLGRLDEAEACYRRTLEIKPDYALAHNNLGVTLQNLGRLKEAEASYRHALEINPNLGEVHWNEGLYRLLIGEFATGWKQYEWRWHRTPGIKPRYFQQPLWLGIENLKDKTILLHAEQGFGDAIQFCRYAKHVANLGAKVILEVPPQLETLLRELEGVTEIVSTGQCLPDFDYHCPLLSLPLAFKADLSNITGQRYIRADRQKTAEWRAKLDQSGNKKIGLVWRGNKEHKNDRNRSITLEEIQVLVNNKAEYYCLQKELGSKDQAILQQTRGIQFFGDELRDFSDTAALIESMDLVISVDTSVAHLAGAMGKEVWVLLPFIPDWRWLLDRSDSPWYQSAKLFRQPRIGDWSSVLIEVKNTLEDIVRGRQ
jgi:tetratricopeptide (TPR) repeat protein